MRYFTPNWFTATMGTGVLALALNQFPLWGFHLLGWGLWIFNIGLFSLFTFLYVGRWLIYPHEAKLIFEHETMSMFFGAIPMGLATIINGFLVFGQDWLGGEAIRIALYLWYIDVVISVIVGIGIPYMMIVRQRHSMESMTAVWLLPIVASEVASVSGGFLTGYLPTDGYQILLTSYILWSLSVPLALSVLVILFMRLILHKLPECTMAATGWLALGPIGTGALSLIVLGNASKTFLPLDGIPHGMGIFGGLLLWAYGLWWLALAVLKTITYLRHDELPFNMGWWGFTFPLGVYSLATLALGRELKFITMTMLGYFLVGLLAVLWAWVASRTIIGARDKLYFSPCLQRAEQRACSESRP